MSKQNINDLGKTFLTKLNFVIRLIDKENKLLTASNSMEGLDNFTEKQKLLDDLFLINSKIQQEKDTNPDWGKNEKLFNEIGNKFRKLEQLLEQSEILWQSTMIVNEQLFDIYKKVKLNQTINKYGYNKKGEIAALKNIEKIMPAISLNDKV